MVQPRITTTSSSRASRQGLSSLVARRQARSVANCGPAVSLLCMAGETITMGRALDSNASRSSAPSPRGSDSRRESVRSSSRRAWLASDVTTVTRKSRPSVVVPMRSLVTRGLAAARARW